MNLAAKKLKNMSETELVVLLGKTREELRLLSFQAANAELKELRKIREAKKLIARILTVMNIEKPEELTKAAKSS